MRKIRIFAYMFLCILFSVPFLGARYPYTKNTTDLFVVNDTVRPGVDSLPAHPDSLKLKSDSLPSDSVKKNKNALDAIVDYSANDSIVMTAEKWAYLFGSGEVKYTDLTLKGELISMDMDSSLVYAKAGTDSVGKEFGFPVFSDKGTDLESKTMKYNFKTKKGYATTSITTQGEGHVIAGIAKKNEDNSFFMRDGKYTTCEDHEHPHFYLALTKGKVKPKKDVVTGPAYLVIEGLPLPIGLPFAFFPFSEKYSSGVIMPSYGDELERGFNLRDGGYYFAINDNIDLALTGEIYTKGSWGVNARSSYKRRYKYSGSFDFGYLVTKTGEKDVDYSVAKDMRINWTHSQDAKADMFRTISASVNFSTSSYDRNNLNSAYTPAGTSNTKASSVNITQRIPNSPWSFSASMNVAQRSRDSTISLTLPNLMMTMSRVQPFKRKEAVGAERWYEKIQMSYSGEVRNSITTKEDKLFKSNLQKDWANGIRHSIPISATFAAFDYLNITPSINYNERWHTSKIEKGLNPKDGSFSAVDTTYSFGRTYDFSAALSFQTMLYGMYTPIFSKSTTIRHVFTPSVSFSYRPDFSDPMWGMYRESRYFDSNSQEKRERWSPYEQGIFGTAPKGASGAISFSFDNNLEMKVATLDTIKKISLIDNLSLNFNYDMMRDSLKWSDIAMNIRLKLSKSFVINLGAAFDPYLYQRDEFDRVRQVDKLRIKHGRGFGRLKSTGYSISPSINQDTFNKWFGKDEGKKDENNPEKPDDPQDGSAQSPSEGESGGSRLTGKGDDNEYDEDGYIKNEVIWNLGFNFSMNYTWDTNNIKEKGPYVEYGGKLVKSFGLNGSIQPTRNWNFNFNATYDFDAKKIAYMSCNLTRNLHCWSISASFNPVGQYKSYYVSLRASSSMLQDLKYEQRGRSSSYDPNWD